MPSCPNCRRYIARFPCPHCRVVPQDNGLMDTDNDDEFLRKFIGETKTVGETITDDDVLTDFIEHVESESKTTQISSWEPSAEQSVPKRVKQHQSFQYMKEIRASPQIKTHSVTPPNKPREGAIKGQSQVQSTRDPASISDLESRLSILEKDIEDLETESKPKSTSQAKARRLRPSDLDSRLSVLERELEALGLESESRHQSRRLETRLKAETPTTRPSKSPLNAELPPHIADVPLSAAEQRIYFQLSMEYQIIINKATTFDEGVYNWNLLLPQRLQTYRLTQDAWNKIAAVGDSNEKMQKELQKLIDKLDN